ncbi:MAG: ribonuclease III [Deltaproteobacteria bacterium]|nr:ribonuclease III [Deltaproteobacteria bacterium]
MTEERMQALKELEAALGYCFEDIGLLDNALTHRSYVNENSSLPCKDNERLEFLGDAVLELAVSDMLMRKFPAYPEGELSKLRASVVNEQPLAELARRFRIGEFLLLGRGEEGSGGRMKPSLLANAFESLVAAMYLDGGFDRAAAFTGRLFEPLIAAGSASAAALYRDYKTTAQEICQTLFQELPRYAIVAETGPDHDKRFEMSLLIGEKTIATGTGRNKKEAEQQAAKIAIENLREIAPLPAGGTETVKP